MEKVIFNKVTEVKNLLSKFKLKDNYLLMLTDLLNIAEARDDKIIFIALVDDEEIVSAGVFSIKKRQVLGVRYSALYLYGYSFFDYNQIYTLPLFEKEFMNLVKTYSKSNAIDLVLLENIKESFLVSNCIIQKDSIQCFDVSNSEKGYDYISKKKSIVRHRNTVIKFFNYEVKHLKGDAITDTHFQHLKSFHMERWGFDGVKSAFLENKRLEFYKGMKERSLLTIITVNQEVLALHFGMINSHRLIWHTPVINIKYLDFSPIEVLLYETSDFCKNNKLRYLDFGLGNETYKYRFSNTKDNVYSYIIPINLASNIKLRLAKVIKVISEYINLAQRLKRAYNYLRKISRSNNKINLYKIEGAKKIQKQNVKNIKFKKITNYVDFVDFARAYNINIKRFQFLRFKERDDYFCVYNEEEVLCDGWARSKSIFISEINQDLIIDKGCILYDFNTNIRHRRKGYYTLLLRDIVSSIDSVLYIYSLKENIGSNKAIQRVGFNSAKQDF
jgi:hypothetical protein